MVTLRSILCPVDFSDHSQHALQLAIALAVQHQSRLVVLTAVDPILAEAARVRFSLDLAKAETEPALRKFVTAALPTTGSWAPQIGVAVSVGDSSDAILQAAEREHSDLIVMGTHGLGGFRKLLLGSTTERVLRRTPVPLLAVPLVEQQAVVHDASRPRFNVKTIVAATDFSDSAGKAVHCAVALAQERAVPLVLTHVVIPVSVPPEWLSYVEGVDEESVEQARILLERLASDLSGQQHSDIMVRLGRPADVIASVAKERGAGLIVMGLTGQGGRLAARPGSIAYRVVCGSHVPVLVVPLPSGSEAATSSSRH